MTFAVQGATSSRAIESAIATCSMSPFMPDFHCDVITGRLVIASNVTDPTNRVAERVITATDVVAVLLQSLGTPRRPCRRRCRR